jgi:hypothetical protein
MLELMELEKLILVKYSWTNLFKLLFYRGVKPVNISFLPYIGA